MFKKVVIIAGVPRSGTSWLGQIFDSAPEVAYRFQPLFSYAFKAAINEDSSKKQIEDFFTALYNSKDPFLLQTDKREAGLYPTFKQKDEPPSVLSMKICRYQYVLSNVVRNFETVKLIGIIRNPCAVISSWSKIPKEFPEGSILEKEWRVGACKNEGRPEEFFGYYKWKEVANLYLDLQSQNPEKVYVVKYEDLVEDGFEQTRRMFEFAGIPFGEQTKGFLAECNMVEKEGPYAVYKSKSVRDKWRQTLDQTIIDKIYADLRGTRLERFLD